MNYIILVLAAAVVGIQLWLRRARKSRAAAQAHTALRLGPLTSDIALISAREIRERLKGRVLRVGTMLILAVVAAAIVIPVLNKSTSTPEQVGVVGRISGLQAVLIRASASEVGTSFRLIHVPVGSEATRELRSGRLDLVIINGQQILVANAIGPTDSSTTALFAQSLAKNLGIANAITDSGLTRQQAAAVLSARPIALVALAKGSTRSPVHSLSVFALIIVFLMLSQYNTWILMGVMDEKSSRVVEVLLAAVRPMQLLAGKVIGIGIVAFGQAALILGFALVLANAVGSSLLRGTAPATLAATFAFLVLGYAFYCWVYAAAGSTVERQDQVQSLAFPLSLPIVFGYVMAIMAVSTGTASTFFKVLAFLPPTAPFAMPVLVSFGEVTWWEVAGAAAMSVICTVLVAQLAAKIYRRAILRNGRRVTLRELLSRGSS